MNDEPLSPDEQARLARARTDVAPPPALEDRTVGALRERGLVRSPRRHATWISIAAAAAILFLVAWALIPGRPAPPAGSRFVLLLYAGNEPVGADAEARRREYAAWARDLASTGVAISGEELGAGIRTVGPGPAAFPAALPRGFFIVSAADADAAERIAASCPHLRHGGRIVVQPIL